MGDTSRWPPFYRWEHLNVTWQYDSLGGRFQEVHYPGSEEEIIFDWDVPQAVAAEFERLLGRWED